MLKTWSMSSFPKWTWTYLCDLSSHYTSLLHKCWTNILHAPLLHACIRSVPLSGMSFISRGQNPTWPIFYPCELSSFLTVAPLTGGLDLSHSLFQILPCCSNLSTYVHLVLLPHLGHIYNLGVKLIPTSKDHQKSEWRITCKILRKLLSTY